MRKGKNTSGTDKKKLLNGNAHFRSLFQRRLRLIESFLSGQTRGTLLIVCYRSQQALHRERGYSSQQQQKTRWPQPIATRGSDVCTTHPCYLYSFAFYKRTQKKKITKVFFLRQNRTTSLFANGMKKLVHPGTCGHLKSQVHAFFCRLWPLQ